MWRDRAIRFAAVLTVAAVATLSGQTPPGDAASVRLSTDVLRDKIRGGWAAQVIGVTFGGPTEFRFNGTMIQDYQPIPWYAGYLKETYDRSPGLYDDIYVDLTFAAVIEAKGLDAPAAAFAAALAGAEYPLWHANQMARYNFRRGLRPPETGHWHHNPDADDIDFQIEADFIGLMSPGMPTTASGFADTVGHIMNSGDGWYGGVFVAAMYSMAFVSNDVQFVVEEALKTIPAGSRFHQTIREVIRLHREHPDDWKRAWFELQRAWAEDVGCVDGVFSAFNIDARINAAYVVLGLLYGAGDMTRTISIATRAGQDSDCNPATAAGVLGTMLGYARIPDYWKQGLAEVEAIPFQHTTLSLNDAYELSYKHALQVIRRGGGRAEADHVLIPVERPEPVRLEQNFEGHYPARQIALGGLVKDEASFEFDGVGFAVQGGARSENDKTPVLTVDVIIDGEVVETAVLPTDFTARRFTPFWRYGLPDGRHTVRLKLRNATPDASLVLNRAIIYASQPPRPAA